MKENTTNDFEVGDVVMITGTRYRGQGRNAGSIVTLAWKHGSMWFFTDRFDKDSGWSLYEGEFRHLTKLEKALR